MKGLHLLKMYHLKINQNLSHQKLIQTLTWIGKYKQDNILLHWSFFLYVVKGLLKCIVNLESVTDPVMMSSLRMICLEIRRSVKHPHLAIYETAWKVRLHTFNLFDLSCHVMQVF